jgi:hypothetical protein
MSDKKPLFSDHRRVGKKFIPPMAGVTEIHYIKRILPEIAWLDYFVKHLGPKKGVETLGVFMESCFHLKDWGRKPDFSLISNYQILTAPDWEQFQNILKAKAIFLDCLDALTSFICCFPSGNPFVNLIADSKIRLQTESEVGLARQVVSRLFDRRSPEATLVQSVSLWIDIKVGKYHVLPDYPFYDFKTIFGNFDSQPSNELAASVRMHVNSNFMVCGDKMGDTWAKYFWNRGRELTPIAIKNSIREVTDKNKCHPVIRFGIDYESYAWQVVDDIWSKLPIDIYQSEFFEVIGALLARQCNLAIKLAQNPTLWDYHAGPLFLRAMTDCYITAAWICKDRIDRAQKFILYGLGQEKLQIEHLKTAVETAQPEDREFLEQRIEIQQAWLNSQHYSFLQHVDVGSWSGISTRKMAEEAGCLDLYNFAYTGWSHAAHGTWNHIGRFDALPSDEPLHKHLWQPANLEHGQQIDVVVQGTKYFDELCTLIVAEFKLKMDLANPNSWLEERLNTLFSEAEQAQTD